MKIPDCIIIPTAVSSVVYLGLMLQREGIKMEQGNKK